MPLGTRSRAAAQSYADATAREIIDRDLSKPLADHDMFDVVVGLWRDLDRFVLDDIHRLMSAGRSIGLICAADDAGLLRLVAAKAQRLNARRSTPAKMVDILATTPLSHIQGARSLLGGTASDESFREELSIPARIMRIVTTSDGLDANLGAGRVTCAIPERHASGDNPPRCVLSGTCHRLNVAVDKVGEHQRYFSPDAFCADILIWQSCAGILTSSPTIDDAWGLGRALAESRGVGALITTIDFVVTSPSLTENLLHQLRQGRSAGSAVAEFAQSADAATHRLFLFGDPEFRTEPMERPALQIGPDAQEPHAAPAYGGVGFGSPDLDLLARAAGVADCPSPRPGLLVDHIAGHCWARLTNVWWPKAIDVRAATQPRRCGICGASCDTLEFTLTPPLTRRSMSICRACGPEADLPEGRDLALSMPRFGEFEIAGRLPSEQWTAAFILYSDLQSETQIRYWPAGADGRPQRCFSPALVLPPGPLRAGFCLIDSSFALVTLPFRADTRIEGEPRLAASMARQNEGAGRKSRAG